MISPRELVRQTLEFARPSRIPRDLWTLPWASDHYPQQLEEIQTRFPNDLVTAPGFLRQPCQVTGDPYRVGKYTDEWGCTFENIQPGVIGEVKQALITNLDDLSALRLPVELLSVELLQVNAFCRATDHFVIAGACPRPFERLQFLCKSENVYLDLAENPTGVAALLARLHQFYLSELEVWAKTEVDALVFMDDWGAQDRLLISPHLWRRLFKPLYKDYIDLAHAHGKKIFMHSDGYTTDILPDLVDLGLDAINCQLFTMNIEELGQHLAGKITFWGEIDRQHLLPNGTPAEIDAAVRRLRTALYRDGGIIAQCEFSAGTRPENVYQVFLSWESI